MGVEAMVDLGDELDGGGKLGSSRSGGADEVAAARVLGLRMMVGAATALRRR